MTPLVLRLCRPARRRLLRWLRKTRDPGEWQRLQIVLGIAEGTPPTTFARVLRCHRSTIYRAVACSRSDGEDGLRDRRREPFPGKVTPAVIDALVVLLEQSPRDVGWARSTWTCELLQREVAARTGVALSRGGRRPPHP